MKSLGFATSVLALLVGSPARAQSPASVDFAALFGSRERVIDASLSPDGLKVALVQPGPQQSTAVQVIDLASGEGKPIYLAKGDPFTVRSCSWASNARIICTLYGITDREEGSYEAYTRLIAMNVDGSEAIPLGARERAQYAVQRTDGFVVDLGDGSSDNILIARLYYPSKGQVNAIGSNLFGLGVDMLNTRNAKVDHVESIKSDAATYLSDGTGNVRMMATYGDLAYSARGEFSYFYRTPGSKTWKPFGSYIGATEKGMRPIGIDSTINAAYVLEKTNGRDALYRVSLDGSMKKELAFAHPQVDVDGVVRIGRRGRIVGARYSTDVPQAEYFDPEIRTMAAKLSKALAPLSLISVIDSSADEKRHLIHAASDVVPGRYYLYDSAKKALTPLVADRPELSGVKLGSMKPITYKASDGTVVPGYLTLPPGGKTTGLPAIVMPHGGPASRDEWGFDWLVQFYVSNGFAVLQPNYRGSAGFGQQWFQENGFRSWRTAISDVNDAGRWLLSEGIADPSKLAIVGWSYGGYAALQANVLDPDLFKAVVAIAPVTDLQMLRNEQGNFLQFARDYVGEGAQLIEGSPIRHVAQFKAPVLMFHGMTDINVSSKETEAMDRALKKAGKSSDAVLYKGIDHQLRDTTVRTDMLTKSASFLRKSLKMSAD